MRGAFCWETWWDSPDRGYVRRKLEGVETEVQRIPREQGSQWMVIWSLRKRVFTKTQTKAPCEGSCFLTRSIEKENHNNRLHSFLSIYQCINQLYSSLLIVLTLQYYNMQHLDMSFQESFPSCFYCNSTSQRNLLLLSFAILRSIKARN